MKIAEPIVLDTFAVLAFLTGERGADIVSEILAHGIPWMTLVNLGEVTYVVERAQGKARADDVFANFLAPERPGGTAIKWLAVDAVLVRRAATLKALGGLSYADCFAAAAAAILGCSVLTGDPEFARVEEAGIRVAWL